MSIQRREDRFSPRPRIEAEVTVEGEASAGCVCKVKELSRSGICLATSDPIAPGRAVHIQLLVTDGPIALIGETIWARPIGRSRFEIGCWYVPDGAEAKDRLEQLLHQQPLDDTPVPRPQ